VCMCMHICEYLCIYVDMCMDMYVQGRPELYICTVYERMYGNSPDKNAVCMVISLLKIMYVHHLYP